eukprot:295938-Chlamydomonas_euryale.AAC.3
MRQKRRGGTILAGCVQAIVVGGVCTWYFKFFSSARIILVIIIIRKWEELFTFSAQVGTTTTMSTPRVACRVACLANLRDPAHRRGCAGRLRIRGCLDNGRSPLTSPWKELPQGNSYPQRAPSTLVVPRTPRTSPPPTVARRLQHPFRHWRRARSRSHIRHATGPWGVAPCNRVPGLARPVPPSPPPPTQHRVLDMRAAGAPRRAFAAAFQPLLRAAASGRGRHDRSPPFPSPSRLLPPGNLSLSSTGPRAQAAAEPPRAERALVRRGHPDRG